MKNQIRSIILVSNILICMNSLHAQWIRTYDLGPYGASCFASLKTNIFAGAGGKGVYRSSNSGTNWMAVNTGLPQFFNVLALTTSGDNIFVGLGSGSIYVSANNGDNWTPANNGISGSVLSFAISGANIFACTDYNGVFVSSDNGANWRAVNNGIQNLFVAHLAASGKNIYAGTLGQGVYLSTNDGADWNPVNTGISDLYIYSINASGANVYAGTGDGIFRSTNNGASWVKIGLANTQITTIALLDTNVFAGTRSSGVYVSSQNDTTWHASNTDLKNPFTKVLGLFGEYLFDGTYGGVEINGGIWRRPVLELITSIRGGLNEVPRKITLEQNYPNPFNPTTTISFSLPTKSLVTLQIFDVMGRGVATIVSDVLPAGNYSRQWSAAGFPSGIYFYRLQAGTYIETKRLLLIK